MTREEKYDLVNQCETPEALEVVILGLADEDGTIEGRDKLFQAKNMARGLRHYMENKTPPNILTRRFGIRQQAMYLKFYTTMNEEFYEERKKDNRSI